MIVLYIPAMIFPNISYLVVNHPICMDKLGAGDFSGPGSLLFSDQPTQLQVAVEPGTILSKTMLHFSEKFVPVPIGIGQLRLAGQIKPFKS